MTHTVSQQEISQNPLIMGIRGITSPTCIKILNSIILKYMRYGKVFPSQTCLALEAGVTRQTVNELTEFLDQLGIVKKKRRYNTTCVYTINPLVIQMRHLLWDKLWALKTLSLFLLSSALAAGFAGGPDIKNNSLFINNHQSSIGDRYPTKRMISTYRMGDDEIKREEGLVVKQSVKEHIVKTFGFSEEHLSQYSDDLLTRALRRYTQVISKRQINNPSGYLKTIIIQMSEEPQDPKRGSSNGFKQERAKSVPAYNHSPSSEAPNLTHIEQIEFLMNEISKFAKAFDTTQIHSRTDVMSGYALMIGENSVKAMQKEVERLLEVFNDSEHVCRPGCVDASQFIRAKKDVIIDKKLIPWDQEYEDHLDDISKDKSDPAGFKLMVKRTDLRRRGIDPDGVIYGTKK